MEQWLIEQGPLKNNNYFIAIEEQKYLNYI